MSVLLGLLAAVLAFMLPLFERDGAQRVRDLRPRDAKSVRTGPLTRIGRVLFAHAQRHVPALRKYALSDDTLVRVLQGSMVVLIVGLFKPLLALLFAVTALSYPPLKARSVRNRRLVLLERQLPTVIDLFRIAVDAGMNVPMALEAVGTRTGNPLGLDLRTTSKQISRGQRISDALDDLVERTGEAVRPLAAALSSAERYGSPLSVVLERLAHESRIDQERRAERLAKRLSISLLFPVAGCTLPAFALLTVAPLLAGSFSTLASSFS